MELVIEEIKNKVDASNKLKLKYSNIILSKSLRFNGIMNGIFNFIKNYEKRENKDFYFIIVKYNCLDNFLNCIIKIVNRDDFKHICYLNFEFDLILHNPYLCSSIINNRETIKKEIKNLYNECNFAIGDVYKNFYVNFSKFMNRNNAEINILNNEKKFKIKSFCKNYITTTAKNRFKNHNVIINIETNNKINFMNKFNIYTLLENYINETINLIDVVNNEKVIDLNGSIYSSKSIYENKEKEEECCVCYENTIFLTKCCKNNTCEECYAKLKKCAMCRNIFIEKCIFE